MSAAMCLACLLFLLGGAWCSGDGNGDVVPNKEGTLVHQHARKLQEGENSTRIMNAGVFTPCRSDYDCVTYLGWGKCNVATGLCYLGSFGESCSVNANCQSNACSTFFKVCVQTGCSSSCLYNPATFCWEGFCYPQQPNGGLCRQNSDCSSNNCYNGVCGNTAPQLCGCPTCNVCPSGYYCSSTAYGTAGFCYLKLNVGTPCTSNNQCSSNWCSNGRCATAAPPQCSCPGCGGCPSNTYCDGTACRPKLNNGGYCFAGYQCQSNNCQGQFCAPATQQCGCVGCPLCPSHQYCSSGYQCINKLALGSTCSADSQCQSSYCHPTLRVCFNLGTPCSGPNAYCPAGQYCQSNPLSGFYCANKKQNGYDCGSNTECQSNYCHPTQRVCANNNVGTPCSGSNSYCPPGQYCQSGFAGWTCVPKKSNGVACYSGSECQSNYCHPTLRVCYSQSNGGGNTCSGWGGACPAGQYCLSGFAGWTCVPKKPLKSYCTAEFECLSQVCYLNKCEEVAIGRKI